MNNAFERGFIKAAVNQGLPTDVVRRISELANNQQWMVDSALTGAVPAGLAGAAGGGLLGYLSGRNKDPQKNKSTRNAILGALGGGTVGALGGAYHGVDSAIRSDVIDPAHNIMHPMAERSQKHPYLAALGEKYLGRPNGNRLISADDALHNFSLWKTILTKGRNMEALSKL